MAQGKGKKRVVAKKNPQSTGKFQKGNTAGSKSHRPSAKKKRAHSEAFKAAVTITDIKDIAKKLVKEAKAGNAKAAKEVLDRCLGKPPQEVNLGGAGGGPLEINVTVTKTYSKEGQDGGS